MRSLDRKEKILLKEIIKDSNSNLMEKTAASILLSDMNNIENFYNQLSDDEKKEINSFPIVNLWDLKK